MTSCALVTVMVCAPSDTAMWYGFLVSVTSLPCTHPVLPFGRIGSSTSTHPSGRCDFTRNVCGTAVAGSLGSYSQGFGNCWLGAASPGAANTPMLGTVGFTAAMYVM